MLTPENENYLETLLAEIQLDDSEARRHLAAGRPVYISDPRWPGKATRLHPDGRRDIMVLGEHGELLVGETLEPETLSLGPGHNRR